MKPKSPKSRPGDAQHETPEDARRLEPGRESRVRPRRFVLCLAVFALAVAESPGAADTIRISLHNQPWSLAASLPGYAITIDGSISEHEHYTAATHQTTGANLVVILDRTPGVASLDHCRADRLARSRPRESVRKWDVRFSERGEWLVLEYVAALEGSEIRELNAFACTVKDDVYVDLHFAKAFFRPEEAGLFGPILNSIRFEPRDSAVLHYERGNALYEAQDAEGAAAAYREAIRLDPKMADAHTALGTALSKLGDSIGAMGAYRQALLLQPTHAHARLGLGTLYEADGDFDAALREFRNAARADPDLAAARHSLGRVLQEKGDLEGAIAEYQAALSLIPELPDARFSLAAALQARGDLDGAIEAYRRAVEAYVAGPDADDSKLAAVRVKLGLALFLRDRDAEAALAELREAVRLQPDSAPARLVLAGLLMARGDRRSALEECRAATELAPGDEEIRARCRELGQGAP